MKRDMSSVKQIKNLFQYLQTIKNLDPNNIMCKEYFQTVNR